MVNETRLRTSPGPSISQPSPLSTTTASFPSPTSSSHMEERADPSSHHPISSSADTQSLFQQALPPPLPPQAPSVTEGVHEGENKLIEVAEIREGSAERIIRQVISLSDPRIQGDEDRDEAFISSRTSESSSIILPVSQEFLAQVNGTLPGPPPPLLESIGALSNVKEKTKINEGVEEKEEETKESLIMKDEESKVKEVIQEKEENMVDPKDNQQGDRSNVQGKLISPPPSFP